MRVYVAVHGEQCEGYSIVSIHAKKEDAIKAAKSVRTCFEDGWQADGEDCWMNGCDFIKVEEHEVEE